jgi:hypothetical protein
VLLFNLYKGIGIVFLKIAIAEPSKQRTRKMADKGSESTFLSFDLQGRFVVCVIDVVLFICILDSYTESCFIYVSPVL